MTWQRIIAYRIEELIPHVLKYLYPFFSGLFEDDSFVNLANTNMETFCNDLKKIKTELPIFGYGHFYELQASYTRYKSILVAASADEKSLLATKALFGNLMSIDQLVSEGSRAMILKDKRRYFVALRKALVTDIESLIILLKCRRRKKKK